MEKHSRVLTILEKHIVQDKKITVGGLAPVSISLSNDWQSSTASFVCATLHFGINHDNPSVNIICKISEQSHLQVALMEAHMYSCILPQTPSIPVPKYYGMLSEKEDLHIILLEDLRQRASPSTSPPSPRMLEQVISLMAQFHAYWWQSPDIFNSSYFSTPASISDVTRMPQAFGVSAHAQQCKHALNLFLEKHSHELSSEEIALLSDLMSVWETMFTQRIAQGHLTLIHGDLHPLGNIFLTHEYFTAPSPSSFSNSSSLPSCASPSSAPLSSNTSTPVIIDWAQCKLGIGAHDIMYLLLSARCENRIARDTHLLRMYHTILMREITNANAHSTSSAKCKTTNAILTNSPSETTNAHTISSSAIPLQEVYTFEQCVWDFRFSMLTNMFQSIFQDSMKWLCVNIEVVHEWNCKLIVSK